MAINPISFPNYPINSTVDQSQWSSLSNLGNVYREAQNRQKLADLGKGLAAGTTDYRTAAGSLFDMGQPDAGLKFIGLAEARRKQADEAAAAGELGQYFGGRAPPATPAPRADAGVPGAPVEPAGPVVATAQDPAPLPPPAVPVPSSSRVIGTDEGVKLGLYPPPPVRSAAAAPPLNIVPPQAAPDTPVTPQARLQSSFAQAPAVPSFDEGPTIEHVPTLMRMLPRLSEANQGIVKEAIKFAWDNAKPTAEISTLKALQKEPELFAMAKQLAEAKANKINLPAGEKKYDETMNAALGEQHAALIKDVFKVPTIKNNLDAAERAMAQPGFADGTFAPAIVAARKALVAMGVADASDVAPNELFKKLQNKALMDSGGTASGLGPSISNADAKIIQDSTFNQTNTAAGNRMIIGFQRLMEDQKVKFARAVNKYAAEHNNRLDIGVMDHMLNWAEDPKNKLDFSKVPGLNGDGTPKNVPFTVGPR